MKRWYAAVAVLTVLLSPVSARTEPSAGNGDPAAEVQRVFARKCAGCHGADLPKPQGRFGYVLDLRRVANNPEMVIPGRPDESELWALVSHGDMPPPDSPQGALTTAEKETIRAWIAAGAPNARAVPAGVSDKPPDHESPVAAPSLSPTERTVRFLGKFHLLLLHFPIALLLAAVVGEVLALWRGRREPPPHVQFCLTLAALAVIPTVVLGWLHAASGNGVGAPQLLTLHRWLGTAAGVGVIVAALYAQRDTRRGTRSRWSRIALVGAMLLVAVTAHAGGLLAHGRDFFDW